MLPPKAHKCSVSGAGQASPNARPSECRLYNCRAQNCTKYLYSNLYVCQLLHVRAYSSEHTSIRTHVNRTSHRITVKSSGASFHNRVRVWFNSKQTEKAQVVVGSTRTLSLLSLSTYRRRLSRWRTICELFGGTHAIEQRNGNAERGLVGRHTLRQLCQPPRATLEREMPTDSGSFAQTAPCCEFRVCPEVC